MQQCCFNKEGPGCESLFGALLYGLLHGLLIFPLPSSHSPMHIRLIGDYNRYECMTGVSLVMDCQPVQAVVLSLSSCQLAPAPPRAWSQSGISEMNQQVLNFQGCYLYIDLGIIYFYNLKKNCSHKIKCLLMVIAFVVVIKIQLVQNPSNVYGLQIIHYSNTSKIHLWKTTSANCWERIWVQLLPYLCYICSPLDVSINTDILVRRRCFTTFPMSVSIDCRSEKRSYRVNVVRWGPQLIHQSISYTHAVFPVRLFNRLA